MFIKQSRGIVLIGVAALIYWGASSWMDKPYTNIEHQDKDTIRGKKPIWSYGFSKLYSQRRTLEGVQDYAMYIYVHSRYGIQWAFVSVDGVRTNLYVPYGTSSFTYELAGVKTLGTHTYALDSLDMEGNRGHSQCYLTLTAGKEGNP